MGLAMGCIGMSMDDFCRCTPSEFQQVAKAWNASLERRERTSWEQVRTSCLCMLQPHSRQRLAPTDLMVFPWEKEKPANKPATSGKKTSTEELMRRYAEAKKRYGMG